MALTFDNLEPGDFQPTSVNGGLPKLVRIWEHLRDLNTGGYGGAVLVDVKDAISKGNNGVTSCSPFTGTCIYMALDPRPFDAAQPWSLKGPYEPLFDGGKPLDVNFYRLHNSFGLSTYASVKDKKFAAWKADFKKRYVERIPQLANDFSAFKFINHSAGSVIALNLGTRVDSKKMRRGDMVGIDWRNGNGHATFCWNVHLDKNGEVDCFQFISSNGTSANGGAGITIFRYPDVDPAYLEKSGGKYRKKKDMFSGIVDDPRAYPEYIQKPYWWFGLPGVKKGDVDLGTFGAPANTVQISYADSMDVSVHQVHVARLHGVTPPEAYLRAHGGKTPQPRESAKPAPLTKAKAKKVDEGAAKGGQAKTEPVKAPPGQPHPVQEELEGHLQTLWKTRWISKDPGDPGSVNDPESQAAIRDYQEKYMKGDVPKLGHADPKTRQRIAKAAAVAANMPMVKAALGLAHERGEIKSAPSPDPMQLDNPTHAAVKEFQQKKGLDPDGIPGHDTQEKLSAYMKEAARSPPASEKQAKGAEPARIVSCYFARNNGPPGKPVTLNITTTPTCNGMEFAITLTRTTPPSMTESAGQIVVAGIKGSLEVPIPADATPGTLFEAVAAGNGLTGKTQSKYEVRTRVDLPFILAGPIVRRAEPKQVWLWFATSEEVTGCKPELSEVHGGGGFGIPTKDPHWRTVRLGERLWVTLASVEPRADVFPRDVAIGYDLEIASASGTVKISKLGLGLNYPGYERPTFVLASKNHRLAHGSCRRPGADGEDAFLAFDDWLSSVSSDMARRPSALFLTGDQIYADDVALSLFKAIRELSKHLMGFDEWMPTDGSGGSTAAGEMVYTDPDSKAHPPKNSRRAIVLRYGFTTEDGPAHLFTFGEFAAMYLLVWNPKLCEQYGLEKNLSNDSRTYDPNLKGFTKAVAAARRVLANIPTYMVFDDHEITDDWNIDQDWESNTDNSFGRRLIANALAAYWAFQGWGNDPDRMGSSKPDLAAVVRDHLAALATAKGRLYADTKEIRFEQRLLYYRDWCYFAPTRPNVLVADQRTSREFAGRESLIGGAGLRRMRELPRDLKQGEPLVIVLQTPIVPWEPMITMRSYKSRNVDTEWGDLWPDVPKGRADFLSWVKETFDPAYCAIFSGDVHHGYVVKAASWAMAAASRSPAELVLAINQQGDSKSRLSIIQITSSPIKNENDLLNKSVLEAIQGVSSNKYVKAGIAGSLGLLGLLLGRVSDAEAADRLSTSGFNEVESPNGRFMALAYSALPLQGADAKSVLPKNHFCVVDFHDPRQIAVEFRGPQTNASVTVPLHTSGH